jgi:hypothetical protein
MFVRSHPASDWNDPRPAAAVDDMTNTNTMDIDLTTHTTTDTTTDTTADLTADLEALHTSYVRAINTAIDAGDDEAVADLAADHDRERAALVDAHRRGGSRRTRLFRRH